MKLIFSITLPHTHCIALQFWTGIAIILCTLWLQDYVIQGAHLTTTVYCILYSALHSNALYCTVVHFTALHYSALQSSALLCGAVYNQLTVCCAATHFVCNCLDILTFHIPQSQYCWVVLSTVHCTMWAVYCVLSNVYRVLYTVRCVLYTVLCELFTQNLDVHST